MRRALRGWLFGGALLAAVARAGATPLATLSIIDAGSAALARKLRAESAYAGFSTVGAVAGGGAPGQAMEPVAVVRVVSASRVELRVAALDGHVSRIELVRADGEGDSFALRVIEQARARLVDLGWEVPAERSPAGNAGSASAAELSPPGNAESASAAEPSPPGNAESASAAPNAGERASPVASVALERPAGAASDRLSDAALGPDATPRSLLALDAGIAASWAAGGVGVTPHALLGLRGRHETRWGASATALLPLAGSDVVAPEGEAHVSWSALAVGLDHELPLPAPWFASAGLGAGLWVIDVRGEARAEFEGRHDRVFAGAFFVELSVGPRVASWLALRATLLTGLNAPRPVVEFDAREVASLGRLFGVLGLSADFGLISAPIDPP
jgi:hypothetical protein